MARDKLHRRRVFPSRSLRGAAFFVSFLCLSPVFSPLAQGGEDARALTLARRVLVEKYREAVSGGREEFLRLVHPEGRGALPTGEKWHRWIAGERRMLSASSGSVLWRVPGPGPRRVEEVLFFTGEGGDLTGVVAFTFREGRSWLDLPETFRLRRVLSSLRVQTGKVLASFHVVPGKHFLFVHNLGPKAFDYTRDSMNELYRRFPEIFPAPLVQGFRGYSDIAPLLVVAVFSRRAHYQKFCRLYNPASERTGGFANSRGFFVTWYNPRIKRIIWHEGAHLLIYRRAALLSRLSWLNEGLAEYVREREFHSDWRREMRLRIETGKYLPLADFIERPRLSTRDEYRQAQSVIEYLAARRKAGFRRFLLELKRHPFASTGEHNRLFLDVLGVNTAELEEEWKRFLLERGSPARPTVRYPLDRRRK